jgi:hypothetical protein
MQRAGRHRADQQRPQFGVGHDLNDGILDGQPGALSGGVGDRLLEPVGQRVDDPVQPIELVGQLLAGRPAVDRCCGHGLPPKGVMGRCRIRASPERSKVGALCPRA